MRLFRSLLANLATLLLSLILAIIIWANGSQVDDPNVRRALQIPVEFINRPDDTIMILPANENQTVLIGYEGPQSILAELTAADFSVTVDLSQVALGQEQLVPIEVDPRNDQISVDPPAPDQMNVYLEQKISRDIPVDLEIRGSVARGHTRGTTLIDPEFITVVGIATEVEALDFARVTVFLNNDNQTIIESRQPIFYDQQGRVASVRNLDLSVEEVEVTIPVNESEDFAEKIITIDLVGEPAEGYRVLDATIEPSSVLVTGRPTLLQQPFLVQTEPIDITGLNETFQAQVSLVLPQGIEQDEVQEIVVTVQIEPFNSTKVFNRPVEILGVNEELETTIDPEEVRIILFGPSPVLEAVTDQEVRVTLDLFGLEEGFYSLVPDVVIPDRGLEQRSIEPSTITVGITRPLTITNGITGTLPVTDTSSLMRRNMVKNEGGTLTLTCGQGCSGVTAMAMPHHATVVSWFSPPFASASATAERVHFIVLPKREIAI